jgi:uncharacterized membrane protein
MAESIKRDSDDEARGNQRAIIGAGIAVAAAAGAAVLLSRKGKDDQPEGMISEAPPWTYKDKPEGDAGELIGRSQTINKPRQEVYERWRDFTRFPEFMDNVRTIEKLDEKRSKWTIEAPAGTTVELVTEIVSDVSGERIAWRSVEGSGVETTGEVTFRDAPPGRGTVVTLLLTYDPPAGTLGKMVAKLFQREPAIQARRDVRRFKQLLETGEVTRNASPSARKSESPTEARI